MTMQNTAPSNGDQTVIMTNWFKSNRLKVLREPSEWRNGIMSREDVAAYLLDAVEKSLDIHADVVLTR